MGYDDKVMGLVQDLLREEFEPASNGHRLHTADCPTIADLVGMADNGIDAANTSHVRGCGYCQLTITAAWDQRCPSVAVLASTLEADDPTGVVLGAHLGNCSRCRLLGAALRSAAWAHRLIGRAAGSVSAIRLPVPTPATSFDDGSRLPYAMEGPLSVGLEGLQLHLRADPALAGATAEVLVVGPEGTIPLRTTLELRSGGARADLALPEDHSAIYEIVAVVLPSGPPSTSADEKEAGWLDDLGAADREDEDGSIPGPPGAGTGS